MTASLTWPHSPSPYENAKEPKKYPTSSWLKMKNSDARSEFFRKSLASWRQELSGTIAQCLNLEHELHHSASKLCILGFEPLESLIRGQLYRYESM